LVTFDTKKLAKIAALFSREVVDNPRSSNANLDSIGANGPQNAAPASNSPSATKKKPCPFPYTIMSYWNALQFLIIVSSGDREHLLSGADKGTDAGQFADSDRLHL